jgi:predicted RNase H-like nuclease
MKRGPQLPYRPLAGVVPCGRGWLVGAGRLQGTTLFAQQPQLLGSFEDVIDYRPSFEILALGCPVGLNEKPTPGGRGCDREARVLLGWPRSAAILSAPARLDIGVRTFAESREHGSGMSGAVIALLPRIAEVDAAMAPYWQRTIFEVRAELSYYQLNGDVPLRGSKYTDAGQAERRLLLKDRLPGVESILDAKLPTVGRHHLLDVAACLWTARRIASRAVSRLPEEGEWDESGLRMEILR